MRRCLSLALSVAILGVAVLASAHYLCLRHARYLYADMARADGIHIRTPISYRGVTVGMVDSLGFSPTGVRLRFRVDRPDVPIRELDSIIDRPVGLFGDRVLEIVPGSGAATLVENGGSLLGRAEIPLPASLDSVTLVFHSKDSGRRPALDSQEAKRHPI